MLRHHRRAIIPVLLPSESDGDALGSLHLVIIAALYSLDPRSKTNVTAGGHL